VLIFLLKKKKRVFFCGVLFREDSFRNIIREKKEEKLVNDESYVSSSECYKNVVKSLLVVFEESVSETDVSNDS
jgi:hypothetical protein